MEGVAVKSPDDNSVPIMSNTVRSTHCVDVSFWRGKRVFVTGHTGFKGGWLCLWLQQMGAHVTGYSRDPVTPPNFFEVACVAAGMTSLIGDICDLPLLETELKQSEAQIVLHLAAQALVQYGYAHPLETYQTNVIGTATLLQAVRQVSTVRAVVVVTTDKCYENREWCWSYRENEPLGGHDPYSSSKAAAELVTSSFRAAYFSEAGSIHVASARAGNVIGGGDWCTNRLIPDMVRALAVGSQVRIRCPTAIRPWQHVLDPLSGYLTLAQRLYEGIQREHFASAFNFGPSDQESRSVQWIAERFSAIWSAQTSWVVDAQDHPHEAQTLKLDSSKALAMLNWRAQLSLVEALEYVVQWHQAHLAGNDMHTMSINQIDEYCRKVNSCSATTANLQ